MNELMIYLTHVYAMLISTLDLIVRISIGAIALYILAEHANAYLQKIETDEYTKHIEIVQIKRFTINGNSVAHITIKALLYYIAGIVGIMFFKELCVFSYPRFAELLLNAVTLAAEYLTVFAILTATLTIGDVFISFANYILLILVYLANKTIDYYQQKFETTEETEEEIREV